MASKSSTEQKGEKEKTAKPKKEKGAKKAAQKKEANKEKEVGEEEVSMTEDWAEFHEKELEKVKSHLFVHLIDLSCVINVDFLDAKRPAEISQIKMN